MRKKWTWKILELLIQQKKKFVVLRNWRSGLYVSRHQFVGYWVFGRLSNVQPEQYRGILPSDSALLCVHVQKMEVWRLSIDVLISTRKVTSGLHVWDMLLLCCESATICISGILLCRKCWRKCYDHLCFRDEPSMSRKVASDVATTHPSYDKCLLCFIFSVIASFSSG